MDEKRLLHDALRHPLRLPYHPLHRFYSGGSLVRTFRKSPTLLMTGVRRTGSDRVRLQEIPIQMELNKV